MTYLHLISLTTKLIYYSPKNFHDAAKFLILDLVSEQTMPLSAPSIDLGRKFLLIRINLLVSVTGF